MVYNFQALHILFQAFACCYIFSLIYAYDLQPWCTIISFPFQCVIIIWFIFTKVIIGNLWIIFNLANSACCIIVFFHNIRLFRINNIRRIINLLSIDRSEFICYINIWILICSTLIILIFFVFLYLFRLSKSIFWILSFHVNILRYSLIFKWTRTL